MKITVRLCRNWPEVTVQNVETGHRGDLRKIKVKSSHLISMTNDSKNPQIIIAVF